MLSAKTLLLTSLAVVTAGYAGFWARSLTRRKQWGWPTVYETVVGSITDFFDTLGIGSYATTTALYRFRRAVDDALLPGTLSVGHTLPTIAQAFIYITIVEVDMMTMVLMIGTSVLGARIGAGVVTKLPRRGIQIGLGLALLAAAGLMLGRQLEYFPPGGEALGLSGVMLGVALVGNFVIGALMTIGVGAYAPILIMISLLGMNPKAGFPIMMGSCAFLMPLSSPTFIRAEKYDVKAAIGLTLGGIPAVLLAAFLVKELPLDAVRWLVVIIVVYTALTMLHSARKSGQGQAVKGEVS